MRIIGHGIDVVKIAEDQGGSGVAEQEVGRKVLFARRARAGRTTPPVHYRYYAGRFAGKEAVVKALGTGFAGDITWRGIEILRRESGAPYVRLSDEVLAFAESLGITDWFISISHCGEITMASAIAVGE